MKYLPTPEALLWSRLRASPDTLSAEVSVDFDPAYRRDGMGWLHWAVWNRCGPSVFIWLLKHGACSTDVNALGLTALEEALSKGHATAIEVLWQAVPSLRWAWALYLDAGEACWATRHQALEALLRLEPCVKGDEQGRSPLFWAALRKDVPGWKLLTTAGAAVDEATRQLLDRPGVDPLWRHLALEQAWVEGQGSPAIARL